MDEQQTQDAEPAGRSSAAPPSAVWIAFLSYAIGAPLILAICGHHLSVQNEDSCNFVVLSVALPILLCGLITWKVARGLSKRVAITTVAFTAIGQFIGMHFSFSYLAPLVSSVLSADVGTIVGLLAFQPDSCGDQ
jgi:hypothetical protein